MINPFAALILACFLIAILVVLFWPERGLFHRWQRTRRMTERVLQEDALKHIHRSERKGNRATMQSVAGDLHITTNEAAELLSRMETSGLLVAVNGDIKLTPMGRDSALHIIRAHRLWERYLADETGFAETEWHEQAEQHEHLMAPSEIDALSARLGNPVRDPHGDPIPTAGGALFAHGGQPLSALKVDVPAQIVHLEDEPEIVYAQLTAEGLRPGMEVRLLDKGAHRIRFWADGDEHVLAPLLAANISVIPMPQASPEPEVLPGKRLSSLQPGEEATVVSVSKACRSSERRRLFDLGILPGAHIEAAFDSPGGDPTAYLVRDTLIALRREQAAMITVEPLEEVRT